MHQCTVLAQAIRMIALRNNHNFGMHLKTGNHFIRLRHVRHKQEFQFCTALTHQRQLRMIESRPCSGLPFPYIGIKNIFHSFFPLFGQRSSGIDIIRSKLRIDFRLPIHAVGNNNREMFAPDIAHCPRLAARRRKIIKFRCLHTRDIGMILPQQNIIHQLARYGNFRFGSLTKRHTNRISQSVTKQRTDAQGRFYTSVFSVSGLRHSKMQGK